MKLTEHQTDSWTPHHKLDPLEKGTFKLIVNDEDLLKDIKWIRGPHQRMVFESFTKVGEDWIQLRAMIYSNNPKVHFWVWPVGGDITNSSPLIERKEIRITSTNPVVDLTIEKAGGFRLHGQGVAVRYFHVDFAQGSWGADQGGEPLKPNSYCPKNPNQTGGLWSYMGITHPVDKISTHELFMMGGYGGYWQDSAGRPLREEDFPDLQASSHIHEHSKDPGWIKYSVPGAHWRDPMAVFQSNQDDQHLCLTSVIAQKSLAAPQNEGLRMLCERLAEVMMFQTPSKNRGTTHDKSGQERAQGRIIKTGVDLYLALQPTSPALALRVAQRIVDRHQIDVRAFIQRHKESGVGFSEFASTGGYSTGEIGIHYWGIWHLHRKLTKLGVLEKDHPQTMHFWMNEARAWCFHSFRFYDIPGDRRWSYPYYQAADGTDLSGPASSAHFGWLAATHYEPRNPTEFTKMDAILELGEHIDERFKG